jgi:hypothetical protein
MINFDQGNALFNDCEGFLTELSAADEAVLTGGKKHGKGRSGSGSGKSKSKSKYGSGSGSGSGGYGHGCGYGYCCGSD